MYFYWLGSNITKHLYAKASHHFLLYILYRFTGRLQTVLFFIGRWWRFVFENIIHSLFIWFLWRCIIVLSIIRLYIYTYCPYPIILLYSGSLFFFSFKGKPPPPPSFFFFYCTSYTNLLCLTTFKYVRKIENIAGLELHKSCLFLDPIWITLEIHPPFFFLLHVL